MGRKKVLEDELSDLEGKLQRAEKLVTGWYHMHVHMPQRACAWCASVHGCAAAKHHHPAPCCLRVATGLAGERSRWESSIAGYEAFLAALPGDALLAAAFLSYAGPFPSEFRHELVKGTWMPQVCACVCACDWLCGKHHLQVAATLRLAASLTLAACTWLTVAALCVPSMGCACR
jgi:hypothetical protein